MFPIFYFLGFYGFSQKDTSDIITYTDKIILKMNLDTRTDIYLYENRQENTSLHLVPNNRFRMFLSLDYEFIGVSVGLVPKFLGANSDEALKGESQFTDYQFRFFLGRWIQSLSYRKIAGNYVRNTGDFAPDWTEGVDPYLQFKGLSSSSYAMSTSYVFNRKFSYRNIVYQNEWQKKSAGSFVPSLYYDYNIFDFDEDGTISKDKYFNIKTAPSYYYTYVLHRKWFLSGNVSPALGVRFSKSESVVDDVRTTERNTFFIRSVAAGVNLGYSSERVIFGINANFSAEWYKEESTSMVENDQFYGVLYVGYRFDPPSIVKKIFKPLTGN
ncbi:MAG: DUF4421 family protein [Muricauda sp.]|nr:DUF4421 family protein [Allomuricauda sp.]